jgi:carbamoyltransferase
VNVLGISAYYHDSAATLIRGGELVAAAQEERFSRKKHDSRFPSAAIRYCLEQGGLSGGDIDHVVFYDKPLLKFERLLDTYLAFSPEGFTSFRTSFPVWMKEKLFLRSELSRDLREACAIDVAPRALLFSEHHLSHAASAFFPSPFEDAAILTVDGVGEWTTTSLAHGKGRDIEILEELHFPHSLGLLYSAFTYYLGFKVNSGEYKVMGLAPYGEPRYADVIRDHLIDIRDDGSFQLDISYFDYCTGLRMTNARFDALFGKPPRRESEPLTRREMDLAASLQLVTEEAMLKLAAHAKRVTGSENLCLAGGVALNCVANGRIQREGPFRGLWIQPAAGDAGGALGAACAAYFLHLDQPRQVNGRDGMHGCYLGPEYAQDEIEERLRAAGAHFTVLADAEIAPATARELAASRIVGWFQDRMEFGPRALGARSILGDPRHPDLQAHLNLRIKYRESFRPFAPAVLREEAHEWFELDTESPYMMLVAPVQPSKRLAPGAGSEQLEGIELLKQKRSLVPAITHVDYSARVQTVDGADNPRFRALLEAFRDLTGCPILVNTSFNVRGEPIVCTPEDAFRCFMSTGMDVLVVGNCFLRKEEQNPNLRITPDPSALDD